MPEPTPSIDRQARRARIVELIASRPIHSQSTLGELLAAEGCVVNQGTLSRDLRDLGVLKGRDGYHLPSGPSATALDPTGRLHQALEQWLVQAVSAENQLVLRTPPGGAQPLALAIDAAAVPGVLGTLAGDDTVLVITPDRRTARQLATRFARETSSAAAQRSNRIPTR